MNYYFIQYHFEKEVEIKYWKQYDKTVLVQADSFENACQKIKEQHEHKFDKIYSFNDLTIR